MEMDAVESLPPTAPPVAELILLSIDWESCGREQVWCGRCQEAIQRSSHRIARRPLPIPTLIFSSA